MNQHRRTPRWWALCLFHNWIAHPLMPLADLLDEIGEKRVSALLHRLHDTTYPEGDG